MNDYFINSNLISTVTIDDSMVISKSVNDIDNLNIRLDEIIKSQAKQIEENKIILEYLINILVDRNIIKKNDVNKYMEGLQIANELVK